MNLQKLRDEFEVYIGAICSGGMVLILFAQVVARYVFNSAFSWAEEVALILFILSIYFGASAAVLRNQHLRLGIVLERVKPKTRLIMDVTNNLFFLLFNAVILFGIIPVIQNLQKNGTSYAVTDVPKWIIYAFLPALFILMAIRLGQDCYYKIKRYQADPSKYIVDTTLEDAGAEVLEDVKNASDEEGSK